MTNSFHDDPAPASAQGNCPGEGEGLRVLFVGNSVTLHGPKPEIGWTRNWGMAASAPEKDYVHLLEKRIRRLDPSAAFSIAQAGQFERTFMDDPDVLTSYTWAKTFGADIVILFFGANVPAAYEKTASPAKTFGQAYEELRALVCGEKTAAFHVQGFYARPKLEEEKRAVAAKYGDVYVPLDRVNCRADVRGEFDHPNDLGMRLIADAIWKHVAPELRRRVTGK